MGRLTEMNAAEVLERLRSQPGVQLVGLPSSSGIYALRDHSGAMRYIGIAHAEGFRTRISNKHTTGSEDRSHKFSCAYNVGRMWRDRYAEQGSDAELAKKLRTAFIRKHCSASFVPIEHYNGKAELETMERGVLDLAKADESVWNRSFKTCDEPTKLVDQLVAERQCSSADLAALQRQLVRWQERK